VLSMRRHSYLLVLIALGPPLLDIARVRPNLRFRRSPPASLIGPELAPGSRLVDPRADDLSWWCDWERT